MATLLLAEHDNKSLKDATAKALTAAKALNEPVHVLVAGDGIEAAARAAAGLAGIEKVLVADDPVYAHQLAEPLAALLVQLAGNYSAILAAATSTGKNVMPRVAALLDVMPISGTTWPQPRESLSVSPAASSETRHRAEPVSASKA